MLPRSDPLLSPTRAGPATRLGMSLVELMLAMTITAMIIGTLGVLARSVQMGFQYAEGHGLATQHARVVLAKITRNIREATANEQFPGVIVLADEEGSYRYPDTLVVWHPPGEPADPEGLPRYDELIIYCPDPENPNRLVEITAPGDTRTVPGFEEEDDWLDEIAAIKEAGGSQINTLTNLVRTGFPKNDDDEPPRGAVRFEMRLRPSADEWEDYDGGDGSLDWEDISWPQGIYGSQTGLRQVWVRIELQLVADGETSTGSRQIIPFLSSAALHYEMHR